MKVQIRHQMQKTAMFYLQHCDLWNLFQKYQNFEFIKKTMHRRKNANKKVLEITFYIFVLNFRALGPIMKLFSRAVYGPLNKLKARVWVISCRMYQCNHKQIKNTFNIQQRWHIAVITQFDVEMIWTRTNFLKPVSLQEYQDEACLIESWP